MITAKILSFLFGISYGVGYLLGAILSLAGLL